MTCLSVERREVDVLRSQCERARAPPCTHHRLDQVCGARFGGRKDYRFHRTVDAQSIGDEDVDLGMLTELLDLLRKRPGHQFVVVVEKAPELAVGHLCADT